MKIKTINNSQPHESWGGWENFIATCEQRDEVAGVIFYGKTNCNYILFPCGTLICNYGYHGQALMNDIRQNGPDAVMANILTAREELLKLMA